MEVVPVVIEFLKTPVVGDLKIFELTTTAVTAVTTTWKYWSKNKIVKKLATLLYTYIHGKFPHKEDFKKFFKEVKPLFNRHTISEVAIIKNYFKLIKDCFYEVTFDDYYWMKYKLELMADPEKMKKYLLKKIYLDRIFKLVLVKLYNCIPPEKEQAQFYNNMVKYYMNSDIEVEDVKHHLDVLNTEVKNQYNSMRGDYDRDFKMEQEELGKIFKKCIVKGQDPALRSAINGVIELIGEQENPMDFDDGMDRIDSLSNQAS